MKLHDSQSSSLGKPFEQVEQAIDKAWEAIHPYERRDIDAEILTHALYPPNTYDGAMNKEAQEAHSLMAARYKELIEQDKASGIHKKDVQFTSIYSQHAGMIRRVRQEWFNRYFLPRVEPLNPKDYEAFLHDKIIYTDLRNQLTPLESHELVTSVSDIGQATSYYRALADLELMPMHGTSAVTLLVPPHVKVTSPLNSHS